MVSARTAMRVMEKATPVKAWLCELDQGRSLRSFHFNFKRGPIYHGGNFGELFVSVSLFVERGLENGRYLFFTEIFGESSHRAIRGDFVMFDALGCTNQLCIAHG